MATSKNEGSKKSTRSSAVPQNQNEMKTTEIRDLIDFIAQSGLNEVDIETKELKLHVKREPDQKVLKSSASVIAPQVTIPQPPIAIPQPQATPPPIQQSVQPTKEEKPTSEKAIEVKSPMIGTFYRSSNPDSPPMVSVGDKITKGQVVCIVEAMKLFNEIESEVSGTIVKVMVENSTPVEYDQVLFVVDPD